MFKKKPKASRRLTFVVTDSDSDFDYSMVQTHPVSSSGDVKIFSNLNPYAGEYVPENRCPSMISIPGETGVQVTGGESSADGEDVTDGDAAEVERSTDGEDLANEDVAKVENSAESEGLSDEKGSGDEQQPTAMDLS